MADVKISALPSATTPLAGTEQIPLVQSGATKKVTVDGLLTAANLGTPTAINLTNATFVPVDQAIGTLPVNHGGTGTTTPALVAGTNVTISGTWPNQTINSTAGTVTGVTATAPVVSSGGSAPVISMAAANGSTNGYLASTDWNTFNNKLASGGPLGTPSSGTATNLTGLPLSTGVTGLLPVANGGTGTATPALVAGTNVTISGTWPNQTINSTAGGSGTVTSVAATVPAFLSVTGSPITTSGTLAISYSGTALPLANGGTAATTAAGARGNILPSYTGNGGKVLAVNVGATDTEWVAAGGTGTVTSVAVSGGTTGLTTSGGPITGAGTITLAGTLAVANGGTGVTTNTGSGSVVLSTNATLVTPILGTPQSGNFSSGTFTWPTFNQNTTGTAAGLSATLSPASGGTGVANNAAATVTSSGNFAYTRTLTGATNVTFPTTGTLATLAGTETLSNKTLTGTKETVFAITDGAGFEINPANGGIQTITLGANRTPAATNFTAGQSVTLMIDDAANYAITWSTVNPTWVGATATGSAPTLATSGYTIIELWKVGSTVYAAYVGVA